MLGRQLVQFALLASTALATPLDVTVAAVKDKSGTAMVNLKNMTGTPQNLASGALYGLPQNENQIPSHFFTDIGFNFARAGGSQLPAKGWIENVTSYEVGISSGHNKSYYPDCQLRRLASLVPCTTMSPPGKRAESSSYCMSRELHPFLTTLTLLQYI
jgi:hypothetical protein